MPPTITPEQRNLLYDHIVMRLTALYDITIAADRENFAEADRLSGEFADYLRLLHEDLGWGEGREEPIELKTPEDVLRRALRRAMGQAEEIIRLDAQEGDERMTRLERNRLLRRTCDQLLEELCA